MPYKRKICKTGVGALWSLASTHNSFPTYLWHVELLRTVVELFRDTMEQENIHIIHHITRT